MDADQYELELRKVDARRTIVIGVVLFGLGVTAGAAWLLFVGLAELNGRAHRAVGGLVVGLCVAGPACIAQGIRKRSRARAFERSLARTPR